jgi:predicted lipoprotein
VEAARSAFADVVVSHATIEWIRIGPVTEDNRLERLLFWPDRKGIALKQVQAVLAEADESATDAAQLGQKSVAVQGVTALEFVLHGTGSETLATGEGEFRCRFGLAISTQMAGIAQAMAEEWRAVDGIGGRLLHPRPENADYRTQLEAVEEIIGLVSHGLEGIKDQRLLPFIAKQDAAAKPKQALFWRSGLTAAALRGNIEGLHKLLEALDIAALPYSGPVGVANSADFEFAQALRAIDLVTDPPEAAVADPKQAQALAYLAILLDSLQAIVGEQLSAHLGLSVGFSSLDGD